MSAELIAKLEQAKCGSRELDFYLARVLGWHGSDDYAKGSWLAHPKDKDASEALCMYPRFTRSLDDAMTLVPEGWSVAGIWQHVKVEKRPWWGCELRRDEPNYRLNRWTGNGAKTAELAVCLEAMKARAA